MSDQKLFDAIKNLLQNEKFDEDYILNKKILYKDGNDNLLKLYENRENKGDKWHQLVRFVLENTEERKFLTEKILGLLLSIYKKYDEYFEITINSKKYALPDRFSDLRRLQLTYQEFFKIYKKIIQRLNFDYPNTVETGTILRGRIDWSKTIKDDPVVFPTQFKTSNWNRKFETPENILLILYAFNLKNDCSKILNKVFLDPLTLDELSKLNEIRENSTRIINSFPFRNVVINAKKISDYGRLSVYQNKLIFQTKKRLNSGKIRNMEYVKLVNWINQYENINISHIVPSKSKNQIKNLANMDKLFELWIFLEFVNYLKSTKKMNVQIKQKKNVTHAIFKINHKEIQFIWGCRFAKFDETKPSHTEYDISWVRDVAPDYVVMYKEKVLAVFDAKNYSNKSSQQNNYDHCVRINGLLDKIKKYHKNKEKHPENIPKWNKNIVETLEKLSLLKPVGFSEYHSCDDKIVKAEYFEKMKKTYIEKISKLGEIKSIDQGYITDKQTSAFHTMLYYMLNLDVNYGGLIFSNDPPSEESQYEYPKIGQTPRFLNSKFRFEHFRIKKDKDEKYVKERQKTLQKIFEIIDDLSNEYDIKQTVST